MQNDQTRPRVLEGKVALVTGAGSGIGAEMARALHRAGARVVLADITGQQESVAQQLGDGSVAVHGDVTQSRDVQTVLATTMSTFGKLDILCNNAGIDGVPAPFAEGTEEDFDRVMAVNVKGVYLGTRYALPIMVEAGGGSIINTASVASTVAVPMMGPYCASKGAVLMLTKAAAIEYAAQGVRANCICPGVIQTALVGNIPDDVLEGAKARIPMGRAGLPSDIGPLVVYLASDDSSYLTGAAIPVDGGYTSA